MWSAGLHLQTAAKENRLLLQTRLSIPFGRPQRNVRTIWRADRADCGCCAGGVTPPCIIFSPFTCAPVGRITLCAGGQRSVAGCALMRWGWLSPPGMRVYLPANIAGYVGADHTAALLSSRVYKDGSPQVLVDIGTNTEISLVHAGKTYTCSTASGPALRRTHP